jgi:hypothetical protein
MRTVVFTCANPAYEDFAPLYAASVLSHTRSSLVEIGVQDTQSFLNNYGAAWSLIDEHFKKRAFLRSVNFTPSVLPNTIRFINQPHCSGEYIYIGDIDVLILEQGFPNIHINHMRKNGLPYSNSVRPGTDRMSGLHFARYSSFYPLPDTSSIDLSLNDERVLFKICKLKGIPLRPDAPWFRPVHGIHLSPNREPEMSMRGGRSIPGWGYKPYLMRYQQFTNEPFFCALRQHLSPRISAMLKTLDSLAASRAPKIRATQAEVDARAEDDRKKP